MSEEFDFESIKNKALEQLKSGKPLLGKDGAFAPLLESISLIPQHYYKIFFLST